MIPSLSQSTENKQGKYLRCYQPLLVVLAGALTLGLFSAACSSPNQPASLGRSGQHTSANAESSQAVTILTLTAIPSRNAAFQQAQLQELAVYLQEKVGISVQVEMAKTYGQAVNLLLGEKADLASLGVFAYLQARDRNPQLEPLVMPIAEATGRPWYTSVIVARTTTGIQTIADLKGKRFSFLSRSSTSGFLVPSAHFQAIGIDPEKDFSKVEYSGGHDRSAELLASGQVDAIATDKESYLREQKAGVLTAETYNIIWESDPIPNGPIVVSPSLPEPLKIELKKAFLQAPAGFVDANGADISGYSIAEDSDYDTIRRLKAMLRL